MQPADTELVTRALSGSSAAFRALIHRYGSTVQGLIFNFLGRKDVLEDLAQEVFFQTYRSLPSLKRKDRFGSWVYGITRRVCMNWLRRQRGPMLSLESAANAANAIDDRDPGNEFAEQSAEKELLTIVHSLPLIYREVVTLRYFEDLSYQEMASILDISVSAINVRLVKARKMLRDKLERVSSETIT
jgi:RNA polymerase sigma-70 factor (ECF subfamily)